MAVSATFLFSLSGLQAARDRQAVSAHNVANVSTPGFKSQRAVQSDQKTGGTGIRSVDSQAQAGPVIRTGGPLDLAIAGNGFFQLQSPTGETVYSRAGNFKIDGLGRLTDSGGRMLQPPVAVLPGADSILVTSAGQISAVLPGGAIERVGQMELAHFSNPAGLNRLGENLMGPSASSGPPVVGIPGQGVFGSILPGALEASNVSLVDQMVEQIIDQRSFEANLKPIRAADEMLGSLLDLKQ